MTTKQDAEAEKKLRSIIDAWSAEQDGLQDELLRKKILVFVEIMRRDPSRSTKEIFTELQRIFTDKEELAEIVTEGKKLIDIIADAFNKECLKC